MRIDLYTKVTLTVIALSLSFIAIKDFIPIEKAYAGFKDDAGQKVQYIDKNTLSDNHQEIITTLIRLETMMIENYQLVTNRHETYIIYFDAIMKRILHVVSKD